MSLLEALRKGFGYVLLSMGVSRPQEKPKSSAQKPSAPSAKSGTPHPSPVSPQPPAAPRSEKHAEPTDRNP